MTNTATDDLMESSGFKGREDPAARRLVVPSPRNESQSEDVTSTGAVSGVAPASGENFELLENWQGIVRDVKEDTFIAELRDLLGQYRDEEAEILKSELSDTDLDRLKLGAVFYWSIGYAQPVRNGIPAGPKRRESKIRFRELPRWSESDLRRVRDRVTADRWFWGDSVDDNR